MAVLNLAKALRLIRNIKEEVEEPNALEPEASESTSPPPKPRTGKPRQRTTTSNERRVPISELRRALDPIIAALKEESSEIALDQADRLVELLKAWESHRPQKSVDARVHPASNTILN